MVKIADDLWSLAFGRPELDPCDLARAVEELASRPELDYRSRLLIRDIVVALADFWPPPRVEEWIRSSPAAKSIEAIRQEPFDEVGFPSLRKRLMNKTQPDTIRQYLEYLGQHLSRKIHIDIGGAIALLLPGYLERATSDIDIVGEVPEEIRTSYQVLDDLEKLHGLHLGHVQTRYLPVGWPERVHSLGVFGRLEVSLVDVHDIFLSKLFSARVKDVGDLKVLAPQLEKKVLIERLQISCAPFLATDRLKELAANNWRILFGEELPLIK